MKIFISALIFLTAFHLETSEKALCIEEAFQRTLENSPFLNASRAEVEVHIGEKIQAGAYPNPYFSYSVENVFGNKRWKGWDAAESRYELAQPIILGGKNGYAKKAASYEYLAAVSEYAGVELSISSELKKAFLDVVAFQELLRLAEDQKSIAEAILNVVQAKVDAGKVPPTAKNKSLLELANRKLNLQKARVDLDSAKKTLALFWGSTCPDFCQVVFPFYDIEPCTNEWQDVECHPQLVRARYTYLASKERLRQERAERIPDLTVTVGIKTEREFGERGMIIGAALPLPFFDYNSGNVHKAESEVCQVSILASEIEIKLESRLSILQQESAAAYFEVMHIKSEILPLAEEAFTFAKEGYQEGKFEYLDLLDAQRSLFEIQERYIEALLQFLKKKADIEYLTI